MHLQERLAAVVDCFALGRVTEIVGRSPLQLCDGASGILLIHLHGCASRRHHNVVHQQIEGPLFSSLVGQRLCSMRVSGTVLQAEAQFLADLGFPSQARAVSNLATALFPEGGKREAYTAIILAGVPRK